MITILNGSINEHMDYECCSIPHLLNALNFTYELLLEFGYEKQWTLIKEKKQYSGDYEEYSFWDWDNYDIPEKETYHYSPGWHFTKEDEHYIQDCLNISQCPLCSSNNLDMLSTGAELCLSCNSIFNIPYSKTLIDI